MSMLKDSTILEINFCTLFMTHAFILL